MWHRLWIILFALLPLLATAQKYKFQVRHLTMKDGLPNDYVTHAMQSSDGYTWISSNFNLSRFDGYEVKEFAQNEQFRYPPYATFEDVNGLLWINHFAIADQADWLEKNEKILEIYDPIRDLKTSFAEKFGNQLSLKTSQIAHLTVDARRNIWIVSINGDIFRYDGTFVQVARIPEHYIQQKEGFYFKMAIQEDQIWIAIGEKTNFLNIDNQGKIKEIAISDNIDWMHVDAENCLWISFKNTPRLWRKAKDKNFETLLLPITDPSPRTAVNKHVFDVNIRQQQIWFLYNNNLYVFSLRGDLLATLPSNENDLRFERPNHLFIDIHDNVWLSTAHGLYIISIIKNRFTNYLTELGIQDTREILVDESGGVFVAQGPIHDLKNKLKYELKDAVFIAMAKKGDTFWGAPYSDYLYKFNIATGKGFEVKLDSLLKSRETREYKLHFSKKTGQLWIGGKRCLTTVDTASLRVHSLELYNGFSALKEAFVNAFFENDEGIWLLTDNGLYLLDEQKGIVAHFGEKFPAKNMAHMHEDTQGIFWLATKRGGLLRWDRKNNEIRQFTKKDGLSNDVIYAVYEDDYGFLWLPSNYGLMRFNKESHQVTVYLPEDGIPHHEFNHLSHAQEPNGRLYFGGLGGVTSFHPKDFLGDEEKLAPLRITSFKKLNGRTGELIDFTSDIIKNKSIQLRPFEKSFRLQLALLNYKSSQDNRYAYRIEGLENNWTYIQENYIRLNRLPYGHYTLHIRAQDINRRWKEQRLSIPIQVIKPLYLRWWFLLFVIMILLFLGITLFKWRTGHLQREKLRLEAEVARRTETIERQASELKALDEQKSRFFLNVAHELRTPLTLIATPIAHFFEKKNEKSAPDLLHSIQKHVNHLLRLIESILDLSKLDANQLQLNETPTQFSRLIHTIFSMYESYAYIQNIDYQLNYEASDEILLVDVPKFEKILHNLIFNALKFTGKAGNVIIDVTDSKYEVNIKVTDTGKGIPPEDLDRVFDRYFQSKHTNSSLQGGSGIGLSIAREYAQLMGGKLSVESTVGKGSSFTFIFPKKVAGNNLINGSESIFSNEDKSNFIQNNKPHVSKKSTILLVEDNAEMQALLREIVEPEHRVLQAANGANALEILAEQAIDGIVSDVMMPQMDGFELISRLKADPSWQSIPVIVLTARANEQDKLHALRMGVDDYLYKPFSPQELLVRIQNLLENRQKRLEYLQSLDHHESEAAPSADQQWLQDVESSSLQLLKQNPEFKLPDLADQIHLSERHLRRKIQELTGLTANDYLREIRLQQARQMLEQHSSHTVAEISYAVGFTSPSYFAKLYAERFGRRPSEYL